MSPELKRQVGKLLGRLNPYYNGKYSMRSTQRWRPTSAMVCLNPYYNGKYSMRVKNILN